MSARGRSRGHNGFVKGASFSHCYPPSSLLRYSSSHFYWTDSARTRTSSQTLAIFKSSPKVGPEKAPEYARRAIWGMLHADDACIVSRSPNGLKWMMLVFVKAFDTFGPTISESKTETTCMPIPRTLATQISGKSLGG